MFLSLLTLYSLRHFKHLTLNNTLSPATESFATLDCRTNPALYLTTLIYSLSLTLLSSMCVRQPRPECDSWHSSPKYSAYLLSFAVSLPVFMYMCVCVCVCDDLSFRMPLRTLSLHFFLCPCSILLQTSCEIFWTQQSRRADVQQSGGIRLVFFCKLHIQNLGSKYFIKQSCRSCFRNICTNLCACWEQIITE